MEIAVHRFLSPQVHNVLPGIIYGRIARSIAWLISIVGRQGRYGSRFSGKLSQDHLDLLVFRLDVSYPTIPKDGKRMPSSD